MKNPASKPLGVLVLSLSFLGSVLQGSVLHAQDRTEVDSEGNDRDDNSENDGHERILTIDHFVPHVSTAHVMKASTLSCLCANESTAGIAAIDPLSSWFTARR